MEDILYPIHSFLEQFSFTPKVINGNMLAHKKHIIICGMGGSAISVYLISVLFPSVSVRLHNGYGLPEMEDKHTTLIIINSYSGDTEEMLDVFNEASVHGCAIAILSRGGELIRLAELIGTPYIELPMVSLEPRFSIGHQILGLLMLMGEESKIYELRGIISRVNMLQAEEIGKNFAASLHTKYPVIYSSSLLYPVAYLIKAAINEGSKIPCFVNIVPESNHNELQSFISNDTHRNATNFTFLLLTSSQEIPRVAKRFAIMSELYQNEGFSVVTHTIDHTMPAQIIELILSGYFAATYIAVATNVEPYKTPFIAEFKNKLKGV